MLLCGKENVEGTHVEGTCKQGDHSLPPGRRLNKGGRETRISGLTLQHTFARSHFSFLYLAFPPFDVVVFPPSPLPPPPQVLKGFPVDVRQILLLTHGRPHLFPLHSSRLTHSSTYDSRRIYGDSQSACITEFSARGPPPAVLCCCLHKG